MLDKPAEFLQSHFEIFLRCQNMPDVDLLHGSAWKIGWFRHAKSIRNAPAAVVVDKRLRHAFHGVVKKTYQTI